MSENSSTARKKFPVPLSDQERSDLDVVAALRGQSVTEEARQGVLDWIKKAKTDPAILKQAEAVRAEIEDEAKAKRSAIDSLFSSKADALSKPRAAQKVQPPGMAGGRS